MSPDRPALPRKWFLLAVVMALAVAGGGLLLTRCTPEKQVEPPAPTPPVNDGKDSKPDPAPPATQSLHLLQLDDRGQVIPWGSAASGSFVQLIFSAQPPLPEARATFEFSAGAIGNYGPVPNTTSTSANLTDLPPGNYWWHASVQPSPDADARWISSPTTPPGPDFVILPPLAAPEQLQQADLKGTPLAVGAQTDSGAQLSAVLNPRGIFLEVQVAAADNSWESSRMLSAGAEPSGATLVRFTGPVGPYRWRVRARAANGAASAWTLYTPEAPVHFELTGTNPRASQEHKNNQKQPPEVSPSLSSGGGDGPSKPKPSVVTELPPLWALLYRTWMLWAALGSLAVLAGLLLGSWWKSRPPPPAP